MSGHGQSQMVHHHTSYLFPVLLMKLSTISDIASFIHVLFSALVTRSIYCIRGYFRGGYILRVSLCENFHFNVWLFIVMKTSQQLRK